VNISLQKSNKIVNQQRQYLFDLKTVTYDTAFCLGFTMFYCKCLVLSSLSKVDFFENKNSGRVGWIKVNFMAGIEWGLRCGHDYFQESNMLQKKPKTWLGDHLLRLIIFSYLQSQSYFRLSTQWFCCLLLLLDFGLSQLASFLLFLS
jgi:hypothetical protein